jgi:hypothetical protein
VREQQRPDDPGGRAGPSHDAPISREAYALRRLLQRRGVRLALGAGRLARADLRSARELLGPASALLDQPGPRAVRWTRWPSIRAVSIGAPGPLASHLTTEQLTPSTWRTIVDRDRPDVVALWDPSGWNDTDLRAAVRAPRDALVVYPPALAAELRHRLGNLDGLVALPGRHDVVVDASRCNPIGVPARPELRLVTTSRHTLGGALVASDAVDETAAARTAAGAGGVAVEPRSAYADEPAHARRVLHLLAAGIPTVATATPTLRGALGDGPLDPLLTDDRSLVHRAEEVLACDGRDHLSVLARNRVLTHHSFDALLEGTLTQHGLAPARRRTSVLLASRRADHVPEAIASVLRQRVDDLELVLLLHGIERPPDRALALPAGARAKVLTISADAPLGKVLDDGLDAATGDLVAKMDDDDLYGPDHLADLRRALDYSRADLVGRASNVVYLEDDDVTLHRDLDRQEAWAAHLPGATMLMRGPVARTVRWRHVPNAVDTELVRSVVAQGGSVYSTHRFGFIRRRHGDHTYRAGARSFRRGAPARPGLDRSALAL